MRCRGITSSGSPVDAEIREEGCSRQHPLLPVHNHGVIGIPFGSGRSSLCQPVEDISISSEQGEFQTKRDNIEQHIQFPCLASHWCLRLLDSHKCWRNPNRSLVLVLPRRHTLVEVALSYPPAPYIQDQQALTFQPRKYRQQHKLSRIQVDNMQQTHEPTEDIVSVVEGGARGGE